MVKSQNLYDSAMLDSQVTPSLALPLAFSDFPKGNLKRRTFVCTSLRLRFMFFIPLDFHSHHAIIG